MEKKQTTGAYNNIDQTKKHVMRWKNPEGSVCIKFSNRQNSIPLSVAPGNGQEGLLGREGRELSGVRKIFYVLMGCGLHRCVHPSDAHKRCT